MNEQQYKWQCPICDDVHIDFTPHPLPESLTREILEEVRKMNTSNYLIIMAERSQHMFNHALKGEGIGMLGRIKKELEKEEVDLHGGPGPLMFEAEEEEEEHEEPAQTLDAEKGEEETQKEEQDEVERKEDLDANTEQPSVDTPEGQGEDTSEDSESA